MRYALGQSGPSAKRSVWFEGSLVSQVNRPLTESTFLLSRGESDCRHLSTNGCRNNRRNARPHYESNFPNAVWSADTARDTDALKFWSAKENGVEVGYACRCPLQANGVIYTTLQVSTEQFRTDYINKRNANAGTTNTDL